MEGYQDSVKLYEDSLSAMGTANAKFAIWQESSQAKLEKFQSTLQTIYQSSFDSGLIKDVITFGTELLDVINKLQEKGHLLTTTVGLLSTAFFMFNAKASKSFYTGLMGIFGAVLKIDTSLKTMGTTMTLTEIATVKLGKAVNVLSLAFQRFLPALILTGLVYAIQKIIELRKEAQETEKTFKESITAFSNNQNEFENLKKLSQQYDELNSKVTKSAEEEQKLIDIKNNIGKACEELGVSYDAEGNAIINNSEQIQKYIDLKEQQLELDRKVINETYDTERNSDLSKIKSEKKAIKDLEAELKNVENSKSAYLKNGFNSESREIIALDKRIKELSKSLGEHRKDLFDASKSYDDLNLALLNSNSKFMELDNTIKSNIVSTFNKLAESKKNLNFKDFIGEIDTNVLKSYQDALNVFKTDGNINNLKVAFDKLQNSLVETALKFTKNKKVALEMANTFLKLQDPIGYAQVSLSKFQSAIQTVASATTISTKSIISAFGILGISINKEVANILSGYMGLVAGIQSVADAHNVIAKIANDVTEGGKTTGMADTSYKTSLVTTPLINLGKYYDELNKLQKSINNNPSGGGGVGGGSKDKSSSSSQAAEKELYESKEYSNALSEIDKQLSILNAEKEKLDKTSTQYQDSLRKEITLLQQKQQLAHAEADDLRKRKNDKLWEINQIAGADWFSLSEEKQKSLFDSLYEPKKNEKQKYFNDLLKNYDDIVKSIDSCQSSWQDWQKTIEDTSVELEDIATQIKDLQYESYNNILEASENKLSKFHELSSEYSSEISHQISLRGQEQQSILDEISALEKLIQTEEIGTLKKQKYIDRIKTLASQYWQLERAIDDNKKSLEDLDNKKFENSFTQLERAIEPLNNKISNLASNLDLLSETNFDGKINLINQQMSANKDLVSQLEAQLRQLLSTTPKNATQAQALANAIKNTKSALFSARKETLMYGKELGKLALDKIKYNFDKVTNSLEQQMNVTEHLIDMMVDGIPSGIDLNFKYATDIKDVDITDDAENLAQAGIDVQEEFQFDSLESQHDYQRQMIEEQQKYLSEQTQQFQKFFDDFLKMIADMNGVHIFDTTLSDFARVQGASEETIKQFQELEKKLQQLENNKIKDSKKNTDKAIDINKDGIDDITGEWIGGYEDNLKNTRNYFEDLIDEYGTNWDKIINLVQGKINKYNDLTPSVPSDENNNGSNSNSNGNDNQNNTPLPSPTPTKTLVRTITPANFINQNGVTYMQKANFPSDVQTYIDGNTPVIKIADYPYYGIASVYRAAGYTVEWDTDTSSVKIYKYAKGTKGHSGGLAVVDDGDGNELIVEPNKKPYIYKEKGSKLIDLPKGTTVIPHKETKKILKDYDIPAYAEGTPNWAKEKTKSYQRNGRKRTRSLGWYVGKTFISSSEPTLEEIIKILNPEVLSYNHLDKGIYKISDEIILKSDSAYADFINYHKTWEEQKNNPYGYFTYNNQYYWLDDGSEASQKIKTGEYQWWGGKSDIFEYAKPSNEDITKRGYIPPSQSNIIDLNDLTDADVLRNKPLLIQNDTSTYSNPFGKTYEYGGKFNNTITEAKNVAESKNLEYFGWDNGSGVKYYWTNDTSLIGNSEPNSSQLNNRRISQAKQNAISNNLPYYTYTSIGSNNSQYYWSNDDTYTPIDLSQMTTPGKITQKDVNIRNNHLQQVSNSDYVNSLYDQLVGQSQENVNAYRDEVTKYTAIANKSMGSTFVDDKGNTIKVTANIINEASQKAIESTNSLMSAEKKLKSVIKDRYDYEFTALENEKNGLNDILDLKDDLQHQIDILADTDIKNKLTITEQLLGSTEDQRNALISLRDYAKSERDLYQVGTTEWTVLDNQLKDYNEQIEDVEQNLVDAYIQMERIKMQDFINGEEKQLELDNIKDSLREDEIHDFDTIIAQYEQMDSLNAKDLERLQKQVEIKKLEYKLQNLMNDKNIQTLKQQEDGNWQYEYVADQAAIDETNQQLRQAKVDLINWEEENILLAQLLERYKEYLGITPVSADTGMYTGEWGSNGKLAILHEKELVLNKDDTANLLKGIDILKNINLNDILKPVDMFKNLVSQISLPNLGDVASRSNSKTENVFNISKLEFPDVRNSEEIQNAILNLPRLAMQFK